MQIVIEIPNSIYANLPKIVNGSIASKRILDCVKNGTPLPKGHGDLIDVSRKITVLTYDEQYEEWGEETLTVLEALNKWSDEGVGLADIIIPADKEGEDKE